MSGTVGAGGGVVDSVPTATTPGITMATVAPRLVQTKFDFKASNNDELSFGRGDIVTLTQALDGGWWEGTLKGHTGWFPSNYVTDYKGDQGSTGIPTKSADTPKKEHHYMVTGSFVDTEKEYTEQLSDFLETNLRPLGSSNILPAADYSVLCGNIEEIFSFHRHFLTSLEEDAKLSASRQRIGGIFMKNAGKVQSLYETYARNHPKAVILLSQHKEELGTFMESRSSPAPGILALTTKLSMPFRRLDKYPSLLKELERHIDHAHADRGDTQRALSLYKDIQVMCVEVRKERELEMEILTSTVANWEGEELSSLGDVIVSTHAQLYPFGVGAKITVSGTNAAAAGSEAKDRVLLLFPSCIIMVSVSASLSYQYEGKILTAGMTVALADDNERVSNALEISGHMIDKLVLAFTSAHKQLKWFEKLAQLGGTSTAQGKSTSPLVQVSSTALASKASVRTLPTTPAAKTAKDVTSLLPRITGGGNASLKATGSLSTPMVVPKVTVSSKVTGTTSGKTAAVHHLGAETRKPWSMSCLRPLPPARPTLVASPRTQRRTTTLGRRKASPRVQSEASFLYKKKKSASVKAKSPPVDDSKTLQQDALIYSVINAYCTSTKARHTVNSAILDSPSMIIPEEEKIFTEVTNGNQTIFEEKSLVDTVYAIKDQIRELQKEQVRMRRELEEEQKVRKKWENSLSKAGLTPTHTQQD